MNRLLILAGSLLIGSATMALTFPMPLPGDDLIGHIDYVHAEEGDTLSTLSERYDMGYYEMIEANPSIFRHSPIPPTDTITIPSLFILPNNVPREGIIVNLPELRLYYFAPTGEVITYPLAIGRYEWITPTIVTKIIEKQKNPYWFVPKSIQIEAAKKGINWPDVVPPGPKNPLGNYALRLGNRSYLLHGTNNPSSIGKRASSGCMRLYPQDIESLFDAVSVNTPVRITNEWFKLGIQAGTLYAEIHEPLQETALPMREQKAMLEAAIQDFAMKNSANVDWQAVSEALEDQNGMPVAIGKVDTAPTTAM